MNLQQVKASAEDINDGGDAITNESLSKWEKAVEQYGISLKEIKDGAIVLRDPMIVLAELAKEFNKESADSIKNANLIAAVGGKFRGNQLTALLQNWTMYEKMLKEYSNDNAVNSAMNEAEKTANSLQGRINALSNTWVEFVSEIADTKELKSLVNSVIILVDSFDSVAPELKSIIMLFADLVDVLAKVTKAVGLLPSLTGLVFAKNAFSGKGINFSISGIKDVTSQVTKVTSLFNGASKSIENYFAAVQSGTGTQVAFNNTIANSGKFTTEQIDVMKQLSNEYNVLRNQHSNNIITDDEYRVKLRGLTSEMYNAGNAVNTLTIKEYAAAVASKALSMALNTIIGIGIGILINLAISGISKLINRQKELAQSTEQLAESYKQIKQEADELNKNSKELIPEFAELSKGVDTLGNNVSLTADEYSRYKEIVNQIAKDVPSVVQGYNAEGDAIINLTAVVGELTDAYNKARIAKYNALWNEDDSKNAVKDTDAFFNGDKVEKGLKAFAGRLTAIEGKSNVDADILNTSSYDKLNYLKKIITMQRSEIEDILKMTYRDISAIQDEETRKFNKYVKSLDFKIGMSDEDFQTYRNNLLDQYQTLETEYQSHVYTLENLMDTAFKKTSLYDKLDTIYGDNAENVKSLISSIFNNASDEVLQNLNSQEAIEEYVNNIVRAFEDASPEMLAAIGSLFDFDTSDMTIAEIQDNINNVINTIIENIGQDASGNNYVSSDLLLKILGLDTDSIYRAGDKLDLAFKQLYSRIDFFAKDTSLSDAEDAYNEAIKSLSINTEREVDIWFETLNEATNLEEAIALYREKISGVMSDSATTFDFSEYKDQVDDIVKLVDKIKKAISSLEKGEKLDTSDIIELADELTNISPELGNAVLTAGDDIEKLKKVLTSGLAQSDNGLIATLKSTLPNLAEKDKQVAQGLIDTLERLKTTTSDSSDSYALYSKTLKDTISKMSLLDKIAKEMNSDNELSADTYAELISYGEEYKDVIDNVNGKYVTSVDRIRDVIVAEIELKKKTLEDEVATLQLARAEAQLNAARYGTINGEYAYFDNKIKDLDADIEDKSSKLQALNEAENLYKNWTPNDTTSGNGTKNAVKKQYSQELQILKDQLHDKEITYEQFLTKWQALNDKYHNMSEDEGGISDYDYAQNNREIIDARKDAYEQDKKNYTEAYEKGTITIEQLDAKLVESANKWLGGSKQLADDLKDVTDDIYNYIKSELFDKVDKDAEKLSDSFEKTGDVSYLDKQIETYQNGITDVETLIGNLKAKGYAEESKEIQDLRNQQQEYYDKIYSLEDQRFNKSINDTNIEIENLKRKASETGDTKYLDDAITKLKDNRSAVLNYIEFLKSQGYSEESDKIQSLRNQYIELGDDIVGIYGDVDTQIENTTKQTLTELDRMFEKTGDNTYLTKQIETLMGEKKLVQDEINKLSSETDVNSAEQLKELNNSLAEIDSEIASTYDKITDRITSNIEEQFNTIDREIKQTGDNSKYQIKINIALQGQKDVEEQIQKLLALGYDEGSDVIKGLRKIQQEYVDDVVDFTQDMIDSQVNAINDYKKIQDDVFDKKIKALEKEKKAIEKVNKEEERQLELEKAKRNIYSNLRVAYTGNGNWEVKARQEDLDAYNKALKEEEINKIDDQINALNESKTAFDEGVDKLTTEMQESYKVYGSLSSELIRAIMGDKAADSFINKYNTAIEKKEEERKTVTASSGTWETWTSNVVGNKGNINKLPDTFETFATLMEKFNDHVLNSGVIKLMGESGILRNLANGIAGNTKPFTQEPPVVNITVNVDGNNMDDKQLADKIAAETENKVVQAFNQFANSYTTQLFNLTYSN